jgi:hypothetical protein
MFGLFPGAGSSLDPTEARLITFKKVIGSFTTPDLKQHDTEITYHL